MTKELCPSEKKEGPGRENDLDGAWRCADNASRTPRAAGGGTGATHSATFPPIAQFGRKTLSLHITETVHN